MVKIAFKKYVKINFIDNLSILDDTISKCVFIHIINNVKYIRNIKNGNILVDENECVKKFKIKNLKMFS